MAKAFSECGLVRESLTGTLSRWKNRAFYVDLSSTNEIISNQHGLTKEQAEECVLYAKSAIAILSE